MTSRILIIMVSLGLAGCGSSEGGLSGKVRYHGRPVVYGTVVVIGSDGLPHHGTIEPDGSYEVQGVAAGLATVCVTSAPPPGAAGVLPHRTEGRPRTTDAMRGERGDEEAPPTPAEVIRNWQLIPDRFSDPGQSKLQFTIRRGANAWDISLD